jgi:hypothetical protein
MDANGVNQELTAISQNECLGQPPIESVEAKKASKMEGAL